MTLERPIRLNCSSCGSARLIVRDPSDPPEAESAIGVCGHCVGDGELMFFDQAGRQLEA